MKNKKTAEFIGIFLGDGNFYMDKKNSQYQLRICLDSKEKQFIKYVRKLIEDVFKKKTGIYVCKETETIIYCYGKSLGAKLENIGLKAGKKRYGIPKWILRKNSYLVNCIRGLIDTDGCVYRKSNSKNIPQLMFSSQIPKLLDDFRKSMKKLGFRISKICKRRTTPACGLYAKEEVEKYYSTIGFKNSKHKKRYLYCLAGKLNN